MKIVIILYDKEAVHWKKHVLRNAENPRRLWSSNSGLLGRPSRSTETSDFFWTVHPTRSAIQMLKYNTTLQISLAQRSNDF